MMSAIGEMSSMIIPAKVRSLFASSSWSRSMTEAKPDASGEVDPQLYVMFGNLVGVREQLRNRHL